MSYNIQSSQYIDRKESTEMNNLNLTVRFFDEHIFFEDHFICDEQINGLLVCNQISKHRLSLKL